MDSGQDPILLKKNQASFLTNATVRGGFARPRPPVRKITFIWPDPDTNDVQSAVEQGLWQGGGWYRTDFNQEYIIASISGRIFRFEIINNEATVTEITISGDPNNALVTQVWMWQAEKWMIINDGINLPLFWDNQTMRRSYGPSVQLGEVSAITETTVPAIGVAISVTLTSAWTGPYNVPVIFNDAFYQPIENSGGGYNVTLTNIYDTASGSVAVGTNVTVEPVKVGYLLSPILINLAGGSIGRGHSSRDVLFSSPYTGNAGARLLISGQLWTVIAIYNESGKTVRITNDFTILPPGFTANAGTLVTYASSPGPNVILGFVDPAFARPAIGGSTTVTLSQAYTGENDQIVWIGGGQYSIDSIPASPGTTTLCMINLSDAEGDTYPVPPPNLFIMSVPELPAGRMGCYGQGHVAMCLVDGLSFIYGDTVGGPSGTPANNYRDSVLKTTENTFIEGKGAFRIPSSGDIINAMWFISILDHALGQGPLQIGTSLKILSNAVPPDYTDWVQLTQPIIGESLKGQGPLGQNSTVVANSDTFFRGMDSVGSLKLARNNFDTSWGNAPVSTEMERVITRDNRDLLTYSSAVAFDNRLWMTCAPQASNQGVIHSGMMVMDFDPISNLRIKLPSVWDGLWLCLNVLQFIGDTTGRRAFAFGLNVPLEKIQLYEIQRGIEEYNDNGPTPITWTFESAALFNADVKRPDEWIRLKNGEIGVSNVQGRVDFQVYYRPDKYNCWVPWHQWSICADADSSPLDYPAMGLGEPSGLLCDEASNRPYREALTFQVKLVITGQCYFKRLRLESVTIPTPDFPPPICNADCEQG